MQHIKITSPASRALVLFAHGSRNTQWRKPFDELAEVLRQQQNGLVELAFLELQPPTLSEVVVQLVEQGCGDIRIAPVFFGIGKHVRVDLPQMVALLQAKYPHVRLKVLPTIGEYPAVLQAIAQQLVVDEVFE